MWLWRILVAVVMVTALAGGRAWALSADELLLVVNRNVPEGKRLAEYYALARQVPKGRVVELDLPVAEQLTAERYEQAAVIPLRKFLLDNQLQDKVTCILTFYGVPLRIATRSLDVTGRQEFTELERERTAAAIALKNAVEAAEATARNLDPTFAAPAATQPEVLAERAQNALRRIFESIGRVQDQQRRQQLLALVVNHLAAITGPAGVFRQFGEAELQTPDPANRQKWQAIQHQLQQAQAEAQAAAARRDDPAARQKLRTIAREQFGLLEYLRILYGQHEYLQPAETVAAFDSELSLLWWEGYAHTRWQPNPLHYGVPAEAKFGRALMTMRLDGPSGGTARDIILASLKAERGGLRGKVVLDSRGIPATRDSYGAFDDRIRVLARLLRQNTSLPLTVDDNAAVLPAGSVTDVALYCGWYSVRNYVPSMSFTPGAVGYHVASFELASLRGENEKGWVRGLLNDGIAATLGPVAEPYLHTFPPPDDFFPLLLTGKLTLAEVYWRTTPVTSWMMCMIGDPLYVPFAHNRALDAANLPPRLTPALEPIKLPPLPTTQPAR